MLHLSAFLESATGRQTVLTLSIDDILNVYRTCCTYSKRCGRDMKTYPMSSELNVSTASRLVALIKNLI